MAKKKKLTLLTISADALYFACKQTLATLQSQPIHLPAQKSADQVGGRVSRVSPDAEVEEITAAVTIR